jgi:hypothetical protein
LESGSQLSADSLSALRSKHNVTLN